MKKVKKNYFKKLLKWRKQLWTHETTLQHQADQERFPDELQNNMETNMKENYRKH